VTSCMKTKKEKAILYLGAEMNFCLCFPHLLSDLSENSCKRSEHNDAE